MLGFIRHLEETLRVCGVDLAALIGLCGKDSRCVFVSVA